MKDLLVKLNQINQIPNINFGGCAIVSLAVQRYLNQRNIQSKIVFSYRWRRPKGYLKSCNHSYLKIGKYLYDSEKVYDKVPNYKRIIQDEYDLINCINREDEWNDSFNRRKYVPKIAKILDVDLSDIEF